MEKIIFQRKIIFLARKFRKHRLFFCIIYFNAFRLFGISNSFNIYIIVYPQRDLFGVIHILSKILSYIYILMIICDHILWKKTFY